MGQLASRRFLLGLGLAVIAFQFILSWHFFAERTATYDPSFFIFLQIQSGEPFFALNRVGSLLSQLLPLLAIHQGYGLEVVLRLYSVSFILLYGVFFGILHFGLRDKAATVALLLVISVGFYHNFYYSTAELYQGLALAVIIWALLRKCDNSRFRFAWPWLMAAFLLTIWISLYHQLALLAVLFIAVYELIGRLPKKNFPRYIFAALALLWAVIRVTAFPTSDYESNKTPSLAEFFDYLPQILSLPSFHYFYSHIYLFPALLLLAALALGLMILRLKLWRTLYCSAAVLGYTILILITYHSGESPLMYENYYAVFGLLLAIPFAHTLFQMEKSRLSPYANMLIIFLLLLGGWQIYNGHYTLQYKTDYNVRLTDYLRGQGIRKALIKSVNFPWNYAWIRWALPFETLHSSSLGRPEEAVSVYLPAKPGRLESKLDDPNLFLGPDWAPFWFTSNSMNKNYFQFPENTYYHQINTPMADSTESLFNAQNVKLKGPMQLVSSTPNHTLVVEAGITNFTSDTLHSGLSGARYVKVSYHIYRLNGKQLLWDGERSALECDIYPHSTYTQGVIIKPPRNPGKYRIVLDLVTEGKRWWGLDESFYLRVD